MGEHIQYSDEWLRRSAEDGHIPVNEHHWQEMRVLLTRKKKRRFGFWWWTAGAGIVLLGAMVLLMNDEAKRTNNNNEIAATKSRPGKSTLVSEQVDKTTPDIKKDTGNTSAKSTIDTSGRDDDEQAGSNIPLNNSGNTTVHHTPKPGKKSHKIIVENEVALESETTSITTDELFNTTGKQKGTLAERNKRNKPGLQLRQLIINTDTSLHKNDLPTKTTRQSDQYYLPGLQASAGFNTGSLPFRSNSFSAEPAYRLKTGTHTFMNAAVKLSSVRMNETQEYTQIKTIQPVQGTNAWQTEERYTLFNLRKALLVAPSVSYHYTFNRVAIGAGLQYGILLSPNYTISQKDSGRFYLQQPTFTVNAPFDPMKFNGNQFLASMFQVDFALTKHWALHSRFSMRLWQKNMPGIVAGKTNGINISFGINRSFRKK